MHQLLTVVLRVADHSHQLRPSERRLTDGEPVDQSNGITYHGAVSLVGMSSTDTSTVKPAQSTTQHLLHRPHLPHRLGAEKAPALVHGNTSEQKSPAPSPLPSPSPGRRNSWISGLTSKFSSASPSSASTNDVAGQNGKTPPDKSMPMPQPRRGSLTNGTLPPSDESVPYTPAAPKSSHSSFLQSALRRFQSSSGPLPGMGRIMGGGLCERRVMNIDVHRERCRVPGLEQTKLRRVAFCVDVEIAGAPKYTDNDGDDKGKRCRKEKEKKPRDKEEGGALRQAQTAKETAGEKASKRGGQAEGSEVPTTFAEGESQGEASKKKEKKKKSEEERKERKEKKRRQEEADGAIPIENSRNSDGTPSTMPPSGTTPTTPQLHPTTDPLRIYRRCCQLRETSGLKTIIDQLSAPTCAAATTPGIVTCLDLTDQRMSLADVITLADWLAIVPVRKLKLENCDLGDEAVRVILGGLLAAKAPGTDEASSAPDGAEKEKMPGRHSDKKQTQGKKHGLVEKLSLKNNPKIGRDGWRYISLFLNLSRSIKAVDLSMIPFPRSLSPSQVAGPQLKSGVEKNSMVEMGYLLSEAISQRLAGSYLEELNMSECDLSTEDVVKIIQGVTTSGLRRLGLASNNLTSEAIQHISQFLRTGICEGLDLGGNDLQDLLPVVAQALNDRNPLYALCLADCNLVPSSLSQLLPALASLPNFRFIDLSHNQQLFSTQPNALGLLRKHLPRLRKLKRIHLEDVDLSPEHAIALAEILPESPSLAHLSILENPQLSALASANDETGQEEACALYASLMAAVRVSRTIICIDVDVPSPNSSEVVKALAKQVVAYCLWNMERGPVEEYHAAAVAMTEGRESDSQLAVPDVLLHLVGHAEEQPGHDNSDELAPNRDYVIGGTGVVKALGVCLGNNSAGESNATGSGANTPRAALRGEELGRGKAKEMSKNLLGSARKIRARLQPALLKEAKTGDDMGYRKVPLFPAVTLL